MTMKLTNRLIIAACLAVAWPACAQAVEPLGPKAFSDVDPDYNRKLNEARQALSAEKEQRRKLEQESAAEKKRVKELEEALRQARTAPPRVVPAPQPVQTAPPKPTLAVETQSSDKRDCPDMAVIPAGEYVRGDDSSPNTDEKPERKVKISKPFLLCKTEVTRRQWRAVMGSNPPELTFRNCGDDDCPVESGSWNDAKAFIKKLNEQTGKGYRLPSEAEWEYACRAGGRHTYCGSNNIDAVAWYFDGNSPTETYPVGRKQANAWGLHDMSGNVWEWVEDCWHDNYQGAPIDGSAWTSGKCDARVVRGGSWLRFPDFARAAFREGYYTTVRYDALGFRLARMLP